MPIEIEGRPKISPAAFVKQQALIEGLRRQVLDGYSWGAPLSKDDVESVITCLQDSDMSKNMTKNIIDGLTAYASLPARPAINYFSFISYLNILPSKKIQQAVMSIDDISGKVVLNLFAVAHDGGEEKHLRVNIKNNEYQVAVVAELKADVGSEATLYASTPKNLSRIDEILYMLT